VASFELRTEIAAPLQRVFDLSRSIDIHLDSMSQSRERAVAGVTSGLIGLGEQVTWRARHFGVPFTMTSKIVAMEPPDNFVDEQVRGPFRRFRHEHRFTHDGLVTVMVDLIEFASPLGPVGRAVDRLVLERYMARLISERNRFLKHQAEGPS
jgi:ligand-binding SRPBCC domain-containing protein